MARKNRIEKSGQSPYQRHRKVPFRYSDLYYQWRAALNERKDAEARRLSKMHADRFGPRFIGAEAA